VPTSHPLIDQVRAALEVEPRVNLHRYPIRIEIEGDVVTLSGTVEDISAKRRAVLAASGVQGVREVIDELRVAPSTPMGQDEILVHVRDALYAEPAFCDYRLVTINHKQEREVARAPEPSRGEILVTVEADGRVILGGTVGGLADRRLAGVLAWWVPGSTDVRNDLQVEPPEEDNDGEILEAVELALEKDHAVDHHDITAGCKDAVVTLAGGIPTGAQRRLAEHDAWYVDGVRDVHNELIPVDPAGDFRS